MSCPSSLKLAHFTSLRHVSMDIWLKLVLPQWNNAMYMRCKVHYQEEVQWHQKITIQDYATKYITTVQPQRQSECGRTCQCEFLFRPSANSRTPMEFLSDTLK